MSLQLSHFLFSVFLISFLRCSTSYNVYNYDFNTPVFTPDGLLKQVQYASSAPTHCTPIVIVPIIINSEESDSPECLIIMATLSTNSQVREEGADEEIGNNIVPIKRGQSRIIQIPISTPPAASNNDAYLSQGSGTSLLVGINGLLPDCISLLRHARDQLHSYHKTYGVHRLHTSRDGIVGSSSSISHPSASPFVSASSCASRLARSVADKCQEHSFGGGLRPFGSQIVICGVDREMMNIFVTDPSGAVARHSYDCRLRHNNSEDKRMKQSVQDVLVLGGDEKLQQQIKEHILNCCGGLQSDNQVRDIVNALSHALNKVSKQQSNESDEEIQSTSFVKGLDIVILGSRNCQTMCEEELVKVVKTTR